MGESNQHETVLQMNEHIKFFLSLKEEPPGYQPPKLSSGIHLFLIMCHLLLNPRIMLYWVQNLYATEMSSSQIK